MGNPAEAVAPPGTKGLLLILTGVIPFLPAVDIGAPPPAEGKEDRRGDTS